MKTDCPDIGILLTEFAAGELDAAAAERVVAHVASCADCRTELKSELALRRALGALPVAAGPAIPVPAHGTLSRTRPFARRRWWSLAGGLAAAAVAVAVFLPALRGGAPATDAEVAAIRRDARESLVMVARILERSERHTVVDVFGRQLPAAIRGTLPAAVDTPEGGQG